MSADQHSELLEKINQLNVLRESNATLRADATTHLTSVKTLREQLAQLKMEIDPIKEKAQMLEAELESRHAQISRLEEDNKRWKDRTDQILSKVCDI